MCDKAIYTLVPSSHRGRYALSDPEGPNISSGMPLVILVGGHWIEGRAQHSNHPEADGLIISLHGSQPGYYFVADDGSVCGLCVGMSVRMRSYKSSTVNEQSA